MNNSNPVLQTLLAAVQVSPDNGPLRFHYADMLRQYALWPEAEDAFRVALTLPGVALADAQQGLAEVLYRQQKFDEALEQIQSALSDETLVDKGTAFLLHATILNQMGNLSLAVGEYIRAIDADPSLADLHLAHQLGLEEPSLFDFDETDTFDSIEAVVVESTEPFWPSDFADLIEINNEPPFASELTDELDSWMAQSHYSEWIEQEDFFDDEDVDFELMEKPPINFTNVGGMEAIKEEISLKIIQPILHPELYKTYGKAIGGGILMYGPPGCGKTHLARATAGEVRANFVSVGIDDILDMFIGNSERNLHEMFEIARRNTPCVLFFDEIDALGAKRSDMRQTTGRHLINQFLAELDGINTSNEGILILAATNAPWYLDSAFRRPGRFDSVVFVPPPDAKARAEILRIELDGKPVDRVDYVGLGRGLRDLSGADLKAVVDIAVEAKLKDAIKLGEPAPITTRDLQQAAKRIKPTTKEWFSIARRHARDNGESGLYDDIITYLGAHKQ